MSQSVAVLLKDGQEYMRTWPMRPELAPLFPENRMITAVQLACKTMPAVAVISVALVFNVLGSQQLPQAIAMAALLLSLPLQGILWLGVRANKQLPPAARAWYFDTFEKMQRQGCQSLRSAKRPRYQDLARLLKTAFEELDKAFTQRWF